MSRNFPHHGDPVFALFIWSFTMNDFETLGTLDAAEVFLQDDFDPTPDALDDRWASNMEKLQTLWDEA